MPADLRHTNDQRANYMCFAAGFVERVVHLAKMIGFVKPARDGVEVGHENDEDYDDTIIGFDRNSDVVYQSVLASTYAPYRHGQAVNTEMASIIFFQAAT
ncbi:hypothetical protein F66182_1336 [Fusarium sp. NRRL 66182]|nr:hypothetical protein F66182_1336 [Fusarium sp. NRRL 66182]